MINSDSGYTLLHLYYDAHMVQYHYQHNYCQRYPLSLMWRHLIWYVHHLEYLHPPTFFHTSSFRLSSPKCSEPEGLKPHCVASTAEPNNQGEQLSTQQLKKKIYIKTRTKSTVYCARQETILTVFDQHKRKLSPEADASHDNRKCHVLKIRTHSKSCIHSSTCSRMTLDYVDHMLDFLNLNIYILRMKKVCRLITTFHTFCYLTPRKMNVNKFLNWYYSTLYFYRLSLFDVL